MSKTTILIVEDEAIVAADLAGKLRRLGYEVAATAAQGEAAVALACRFRPQLVLMDIWLEGPLDGIAAAAAIRRQYDVPVVYLTAHSDAATLARAKLTGPFGYILKPFEERELATQIEMALYRHDADRQLRQEREWLRVTLTSIGDAVIAADAEGRITFVNPVAESLTGWKLAEAVGQPVQEVFRIVNEQTGAPLEDPVGRVLRGGQTSELADCAAVLTKDGRAVPVEERAAPIRDAAGQVIGAVLVFHDITERKRIEQRLFETNQRLQALLAAAPIGVSFSDDASCQRVTGNPAVLSQFDVAPEDNLSASAPDPAAPGRQLRFFLDGRQLTDAELPLQRAVTENRVIAPLELEVQLPSGRRWVAEASGAPVRDAQGQVIAGIAVTVDVTERRRAAEAANEAKSQFLANMSHELRTPMNAILGMIDVALPKAADATVRDCLQTAKGSADLLLTLLNDLLDSAKIESGKLELESAPFSLRRMLDQITSVLAVRASEKGLCFCCRLPNETPDVVLGDRTRLQQVLLNLAGNAIKFTERGDVEISLLAQSQAGEACLEFAVRDTGIGIPPSGQARLFQSFSQADSSMPRRFGGTGLGLSISKRLVDRMGGRIWVESQVGQGSTFRFTVRLPLARELPADGAAPAAVPAAACAPLSILLVEDNPANQKFAKYVLQDRGHRVEIAEDGQAAIDLAAQHRFDVILMDVQMPGMNGLEATAAIRQREHPATRRVPIIATTAHAAKGDRERCLAAGMDDYLSKPINGPEMIALVEALAARAQPAASGPPRPAAVRPPSGL